MNSFTLAGSLATLSVSLAACGPSKVEQCNLLIDHASKAQAAVNALSLDSEDPRVLRDGGASVEAVAKKFKTVELKDEKLIGFRGAYADVLSSWSKVVTDIGAATADGKDPSKAAAAALKIQKLVDDANALEKKERALVDEINLYCSGSK